MGDIQVTSTTRDDVRISEMRALAEQLLFKVEQSGDRFTLIRTADLSQTEREENLTLEQAEELLERWKLRGFSGG